MGNQAWYFIYLLHFAESVKFPIMALLLHDPHLFQKHSLGARTPKETSDPSLSSKQCLYLDACHPACHNHRCLSQHRQATLPKHTHVPPPRASPSMKPYFISQTLPAALPWQTRMGCQWCETRIQATQTGGKGRVTSPHAILRVPKPGCRADFHAKKTPWACGGQKQV